MIHLQSKQHLTGSPLRSDHDGEESKHYANDQTHVHM